jgi:hypothetical protein
MPRLARSQVGIGVQQGYQMLNIADSRQRIAHS